MTEIKAVPQSEEAEVLLRKADWCTHPEVDGNYCLKCAHYLPSDWVEHLEVAE